MKITEYRVIYDDKKHPQLDIIRSHEYHGYDLSNESMVQMLNDIFKMDRLAEEYAYVVPQSLNGDILGVYQLSHGNFKETKAENRELFIFLLLVGAEQFVIAHNHPSGNLVKSDNDVAATKKFQELAKILGIEMKEHFIVSRDGYSQLIKQLPENEVILTDFMCDELRSKYLLTDDKISELQLKICQIEGAYDRDEIEYCFGIDLLNQYISLEECEYEMIKENLESETEERVIVCQED